MQKTRRVSLKYCHRDEVNLKREKENNEEEEEEEEDKVNVKGGFFPKHIRQHTTHFGKDRLKMSMLSLKRQNKVAGIGARSLTLDSLKLPSLCTASSVITTSTHTSGPNVAPKSDVIPNAKKTVGIQIRVNRTEIADTILPSVQVKVKIKEKEKDLSSSLSRSLPNIATAVQNDAKPASKHRFERISYSKKLQTRSVEKKDKEDEQAVTEAPSNSLQELEKSDSRVKAL